MTEATWSKHPRALDLYHLRKQNKRDKEKTEISPKRIKVRWTHITPTSGVAITVPLRTTISPLEEQPWTVVRSCQASSTWHSLVIIIVVIVIIIIIIVVIIIIIIIVIIIIITIIITIIIIVIIIIIIRKVKFSIYLSCCIQTPSLLHEFRWGTRQGKRKLSRISANKNKGPSEKRALFAILRDLTEDRALEWRLEVQESTSQPRPHSTFPWLFRPNLKSQGKAPSDEIVHINQIIKHSTFSVDSMLGRSKMNDV